MERLGIEKKYDVIIIGDGVAGISAALICIRQGMKTVLVSDSHLESKREFDRDVVESIHPGVLSLLVYLKMDLDFNSAKLGTYSYVSNGREKKSLNPYSNEVWEGFHVSKTQFIDYFRNEAKKHNLSTFQESIANIIIEDGKIVGVKTRSGLEIFSKYTIDGSGSKRIIGKKMNFYEKLYSPILVAWTGITLTKECDFAESQNAYFIPNRDGWTWIARLKDESFYWTKLSSKQKANFLAPAEFSTHFKTIVSKSANMRWRIFRPLCIEGGILCGDAACLIDPAAGQGILNAINSGIRAGQTAVACIQNSGFENMILAEYDSWYFNNFEKKIIQLKEYYEREGINVVA